MSPKALTVAVECRDETTYKFAIDPEVSLQDAYRVLRVSGWLADPQANIQEVLLGRGDSVLERIRPGDTKDVTGERSTHFKFARKTIFDFRHQSPEEGIYWLACSLPGGKVKKLADMRLLSKPRNGVFFMHMAKTGGSSVNHALSSQFAPGLSQTHIESTVEWQDNPAALQNHEFLSGHLRLDRLDPKLNLENFHLVTVIREPLDQLISHLAWIRRLAEPGEVERFNVHPPLIQAFATKLSRYDLSNPTSIAFLIHSLNERERILVDNHQVRYFAHVRGRWVGPDDVRAACRAAGRFRHIGLSSDMNQFFRTLTIDMHWPTVPEVERLNVTHDFFGMDRNNADLARALFPLMRFDQDLFDYISAHSEFGTPY